MYLFGMGAGSVTGGGVRGADVAEVGETPPSGAAVLSARSALALSGLGNRALSGKPTSIWTQAQNQHTPLQPNLLST